MKKGMSGLILACVALCLWLPAELSARILVLAPHPDDDIIIAAGIVKNALDRGELVTVVYMTNGDFAGTDWGLIRQGEAVAAQQVLGVSEDDLIFLGYPDGFLREIMGNYPDITDQFTAPNGQSVTYGNRGLGRSDYHSHRFGVPAAYNRANIITDLKDILTNFRPEHIFTLSEHDWHQDHLRTYQYLNLALDGILAQDSTYSPIIHKTVVWTEDPNSWPLPLEPTTYLTPFPGLVGTGLIWNDRESLDVPASMQTTTLIENLKYLAVDSHVSQGGASQFLGQFVHMDEIYWPESRTGNRPPVAEAGPGQTVFQGETVSLDGSGSRDPDGSTVTYQWTQVSGPPVVLSDIAVAAPSFLAPSGLTQDTVLAFALIVSDGEFTSVADLANITVEFGGPVNLPPIAVAGPDQAVGIGATVQLNGSGSSDPEGNSLTFRWTQVAGPTVTLSNLITVNPTFTVPTGLAQDTVLGFELVVNDGVLDSTADRVDVTVQTVSGGDGENIAPLAAVSASSESGIQLAVNAVDGVAAGYPVDSSREWATQVERAGAWLQLNWASPYVVDRVVLYDRPNLDDQITSATLTFSDGSSVPVPILNNAGAATVVDFVPRVITSLRVTVNSVSGRTWAIGLAEIEVGGTPFAGGNLPPTAMAGPDQSVAEGVIVQLDGAGSSDPDGDLLTYQWTQVEGPAVALSNAIAATPTFLSPSGLAQDTVLGFELVVSDGVASSAPDRVAITVRSAANGGSSNIAPLAAVSASSESGIQLAVNAVDGVAAGYPVDSSREWATQVERAGAWLQLNWASPYVVDRVVLYDRPNLDDQITSATLTFSDGSSVPVPILNNAGAATVVDFVPRVITSLRVTVNSVSGRTWAIGLAEIEVFGAPTP